MTFDKTMAFNLYKQNFKWGPPMMNSNLHIHLLLFILGLKQSTILLGPMHINGN